MSKRHILKEVNAKSMCGMEIVVEQIFENTLEKNLASAKSNKTGYRFPRL